MTPVAGEEDRKLIHYLWRSPVYFPQENKVFQRPCRILLLYRRIFLTVP